MNYRQLLFVSVLLTCHAITGLQAQTVITSAGASASGGGGSVSFTVGQIVYTTIFSGNYSVAQGVQQPYEISVITGIEKAGGISLDIIVYPNPASDIIRLKTGDYETTHLRYRLYDNMGRLLLTGKVDNNETSIAIGQLKPAAYILIVTEKDISIKSFSIIKR